MKKNTKQSSLIYDSWLIPKKNINDNYRREIFFLYFCTLKAITLVFFDKKDLFFKITSTNK